MSKIKGFVQEFKHFAIKGNMVDMAIAVIIGGAFSKIIDSLVKDVLMPLINLIIGNEVNFNNLFIVLGRPAGYNGPETYEALKAAGANIFAYGSFLTILINFLILAFVVFLIVKAIASARAHFENSKEEEKATAAEPADTVLLREIRDLLKQQGRQPADVASKNSQDSVSQ
ncbi:large conductance mechanosensitive channel protein MscL [Brackiella oedipodis]|uniref:large conductance mechanosensitive channel protein MscL n=1 Tax=Brackiella oedipodis TaxID=124225 RepID=UPI00048B52D0|nr:large conductance mechanosensitive channel protein MscL [Brackiella oedipodis]